MSLLGRRPPKDRDAIPAWARKFFLTGGQPGREEDGHDEYVSAYFFHMPGEPDLKDLWERWRGELLPAWIREHPGTRPWGWWRFDAPSHRLKVGGSGVLYPDGEQVAGFALPGDGFWDEDPDPKNPPLFESEAAFLKRHGLLDAAERSRVKPRAYNPEAWEQGDDDDGELNG
jgi:hypothetical protein